MKSFQGLLRSIAVCALLFFIASSLPAQTNQGVIAGNVLDSSGAAVPSVIIIAKNDQTGSSYNTRSTSAGSYRFPSIQLGLYTITATAAGFKPSVSTGVEAAGKGQSRSIGDASLTMCHPL